MFMKIFAQSAVRKAEIFAVRKAKIFAVPRRLRCSQEATQRFSIRSIRSRERNNAAKKFVFQNSETARIQAAAAGGDPLTEDAAANKKMER